MIVIIDRFEEDIAVVELDGEMINAPRVLFREVKEGDAVELTVLPRKDAGSDETADEIAAKVSRIREATINRFAGEGSQKQEQSDDDPAALFRKLRSKKKKDK